MALQAEIIDIVCRDPHQFSAGTAVPSVATEIPMATLTKSASATLERGRRNAVTAGKIAKSASVVAAKAGATAAVIAGANAVRQGIQKAKAAPKRRKRAQVAAAIAGAAAVTVAGVAIARSRGKKR
jgi:hypothetical protein